MTKAQSGKMINLLSVLINTAETGKEIFADKKIFSDFDFSPKQRLIKARP